MYLLHFPEFTEFLFHLGKAQLYHDQKGVLLFSTRGIVLGQYLGAILIWCRTSYIHKTPLSTYREPCPETSSRILIH